MKISLFILENCKKLVKRVVCKMVEWWEASELNIPLLIKTHILANIIASECDLLFFSVVVGAGAEESTRRVRLRYQIWDDRCFRGGSFSNFHY